MHFTANPSQFFANQTIFLTGGTGGLGGCLLYKLTMQVNTAKIYVLVRRSVAHAVARWRQTMPHQIGEILATKKIHFIVGDIIKPHCGIEPAVLSEMASTVTLIIHAAASINLSNRLRETVSENCLPTLALAQLASTFNNLTRFIYISTAYANSFLPDGVVEEKIYETGDAEKQLGEILETGTLSQCVDCPWPYAVGKNITERLLISRNPSLPLLIVRPSMIAPAISQPFPYYGPSGSCPMSTYIRSYMDSPDSGVFHVSRRHPRGSNIVDEIPVDLVANLILLHIMHDTAGVVHATGQSYAYQSLAQLHADMRPHIPRGLTAPGPPFRYVTDKRIPQGRLAGFWKAMGRDWHFSAEASRSFEALDGPLSIALGDHDVSQFMQERARRIAEESAGTQPRARL
ncbi:NAD-binding domain 4 protein [Mycena belliarum]|uniref:Fatty acyl-CoA reductase n=1 Tax=Mycena belliarum TaxID=1033014 RepID=A0AAD6TVF9_9AGAR|nr:NAD-binding domain 4 protein [Mycena belliae]